MSNKSSKQTSLGKVQTITDICILVEDVERTVQFYTEKLGFELRRRAEGFADFHGAQITLAAWEIDHIHTHAGVSNIRAPRGAHKACIAVELESLEILTDLYNELTANGVLFQEEPKYYPWNAYCAYFSDPDGTLWELYTWGDGGPGDFHEIHDES